MADINTEFMKNFTGDDMITARALFKKVNLTNFLVQMHYRECKITAHNHKINETFRDGPCEVTIYRMDRRCKENDEYIDATIAQCLDYLETKKPSDFFYESSYATGRKEITVQDFMEARFYTYDEITFSWIMKTNKGPMRKKLIQTLTDAGIMKYINEGGDDAKASMNIYELMTTESDEDICWLFSYIGLQPSSLSYRQHGYRKDRTFSEKKRMFEMLRARYYVKPYPNIISACCRFSDDRNEVVYFMKWFYEKALAVCTKYDLPNSFEYCGIQFFDMLEELNAPIEPTFSLKQIIKTKTQTTEEKIRALCWFKKGEYTLSNELFDVASRTGDIDLCRGIVANGVPVSGDNIEKLLFESDRTDTEGNPGLDYDFVTKCLKLALEKVPNYEIPYQNPTDTTPFICSKEYKYHQRYYYNFQGRLYDWMLENYPPMKISIEKQKEINAKREKENKFNQNLHENNDSDNER